MATASRTRDKERNVDHQAKFQRNNPAKAKLIDLRSKVKIAARRLEDTEFNARQKMPQNARKKWERERKKAAATPPSCSSHTRPRLLPAAPTSVLNTLQSISRSAQEEVMEKIREL